MGAGASRNIIKHKSDPELVWPCYIGIFAPMALYAAHDVIDSRWRRRKGGLLWFVIYLISNLMWITAYSIYMHAQLGEDAEAVPPIQANHTEAGAATIAFLVNLLTVRKIVRGFMVFNMLSVVAQRFGLVRPDRASTCTLRCFSCCACAAQQQVHVHVPALRWRYEHAGKLVERNSSVLMDDDFPGDSARLAWLSLIGCMAWRGAASSCVQAWTICRPWFEFGPLSCTLPILFFMCVPLYVVVYPAWFILCKLWQLGASISQAGRGFQSTNVLQDDTDLTIMTTVWLWRSLSEVPGPPPESDYLWPLTHALDRATLLAYLHVRGHRLENLDTSYGCSDVGNFGLRPHEDYDPATSTFDTSFEDGSPSFERVLQAYTHTLKAVNAALLLRVDLEQLQSPSVSCSNKFIDGKTPNRRDRLELLHDAAFELAPRRGPIVSSFLRSAATNLMVRFMCTAVQRAFRFRSRCWPPRAYVRSNPSPHQLTTAVLEDANKPFQEVDAAERSVVSRTKDGVHSPILSIWQEQHLQKLDRETAKAIRTDVKAASRHFSSVSQAGPLQPLPAASDGTTARYAPLIEAYSTSTMSCIIAAVTATRPEQEEKIYKMPALQFHHVVGTARLAFTGIADLHRQLLGTLMRDPNHGSAFDGLLEVQNPTTAHLCPKLPVVEAQQTTDPNSQQETQDAMQCRLARASIAMVAVTDRLVLHAHSTRSDRSVPAAATGADEGILRPWLDTHSLPPLTSEGQDLADSLLSFFRDIPRQLLESSFAISGANFDARDVGWVDGDQGFALFLEKAALVEHDFESISTMMAATFAAVVSNAVVLSEGTTEAHPLPDGVDPPAAHTEQRYSLVLTALHHAVSTAWEYLLWRLQTDRRVLWTRDRVNEVLPPHAVQAWGILRPVAAHAAMESAQALTNVRDAWTGLQDIAHIDDTEVDLFEVTPAGGLNERSNASREDAPATSSRMDQQLANEELAQAGAGHASEAGPHAVSGPNGSPGAHESGSACAFEDFPLPLHEDAEGSFRVTPFDVGPPSARLVEKLQNLSPERTNKLRETAHRVRHAAAQVACSEQAAHLAVAAIGRGRLKLGLFIGPRPAANLSEPRPAADLPERLAGACVAALSLLHYDSFLLVARLLSQEESLDAWTKTWAVREHGPHFKKMQCDVLNQHLPRLSDELPDLEIEAAPTSHTHPPPGRSANSVRALMTYAGLYAADEHSHVDNVTPGNVHPGQSVSQHNPQKKSWQQIRDALTAIQELANLHCASKHRCADDIQALCCGLQAWLAAVPDAQNAAQPEGVPAPDLMRAAVYVRGSVATSAVAEACARGVRHNESHEERPRMRSANTYPASTFAGWMSVEMHARAVSIAVSIAAPHALATPTKACSVHRRGMRLRSAAAEEDAAEAAAKSYRAELQNRKFLGAAVKLDAAAEASARLTRALQLAAQTAYKEAEKQRSQMEYVDVQRNRGSHALDAALWSLHNANNYAADRCQGEQDLAVAWQAYLQLANMRCFPIWHGDAGVRATRVVLVAAAAELGLGRDQDLTLHAERMWTWLEEVGNAEAGSHTQRLPQFVHDAAKGAVEVLHDSKKADNQVWRALALIDAVKVGQDIDANELLPESPTDDKRMWADWKLVAKHASVLCTRIEEAKEYGVHEDEWHPLRWGPRSAAHCMGSRIARALSPQVAAKALGAAVRGGTEPRTEPSTLEGVLFAAEEAGLVVGLRLQRLVRELLSHGVAAKASMAVGA
eukprot:jgi/Ulvmu1/3990/UM183_0009.1